MSGLIAIMDELKATIEAAVTGLEVQVVRGMNLSPTGVSVDIFPGDPFRATTAAGFQETSGELIFTVRARVETADDDTAQDRLLQLMDDEDPICLAAVLEDDQTLNGLASSVEVDGPSGYRWYGDNPGGMLGVQWAVTVLNVIT